MLKEKRNLKAAEKSDSKVKSFYRGFFDGRVSYWEDIYSKEGDFHSRMLNMRMDYAIKMCECRNNESLRVLDVGCGAGIQAKKVADLGNTVYAIDQSHQMIEKVRQVSQTTSKQSLVHFSVGDIENLDFADNYFDRVICLGVLMYLENNDKAIKEMKRVLKPGGIVVIAVSNRIRMDDLLDLPVLSRRIISKIYKKIKPFSAEKKDLIEMGNKTYGPRTKCRPYKFNAMLKEEGFDILEYFSHAFGPFTFNDKILFNDRINIFIDKLFGKLHFLPVISLLGYTYIVKAMKHGQ